MTISSPDELRPEDSWNVVVTVHEDGYARVRSVLQRIGPVQETDFYNVLLMRADDIPAFLVSVDCLFGDDPRLAHDVSRILPLTHTFELRDTGELERRFRDAAMGWLDRLAGRSFHVRLHARGWAKEVSRTAEERVLDTALLDALDARGTPGRIEFDDPDVVIDVEVVGERAGVALWTRADLQRHAYLQVG
jgi:tRNA(Ser,Leu) C12 N-acetylase TAN1